MSEEKGYILQRMESFTVFGPVAEGVLNKTSRTLYVSLGKEPFSGKDVFIIEEPASEVRKLAGEKEIVIDNQTGRELSITTLDDGEEYRIRISLPEG